MKPSIYQIIKKAKEMDIMPEAALAMALRYEEESVNIYMNCEGDIGVNVKFAIDSITRANELRRALKREKQKSENHITDEMVERAREFPVTNLVQFERGKTRCFDHEDKNPSAYYGNRSKKLICPVCNKAWDSIAILQDRDGLTFVEAVKRLANG